MRATPWAPLFTFTVADDAVYEVSEQLTLSVALGGSETDATLGTASANGTIYDEDGTDPSTDIDPPGGTNPTDTLGDKPTVSIAATDASAVEGTTNNTLVFTVTQSNASAFATDIVVTLNLGAVEAADITSVTYIDASGNTQTTSVAALETGLALTIPATDGKPWAAVFTYTGGDDAG